MLSEGSLHCMREAVKVGRRFASLVVQIRIHHMSERIAINSEIVFRGRLNIGMASQFFDVRDVGAVLE